MMIVKLDFDAAVVAVWVGVFHLAGGVAGGGFAVVTGDDLEGHVDAGGDTGRGENAAVFDDVLVIYDGDLRELVAHHV